MKNKKTVILIICIILITIIIVVVSFHFINKEKNLNNPPINNEEINKDNTGDNNESEKQPNLEGILYHIEYIENNNIYDFLIDENFNISVATKEINSNSASILNETHTPISFLNSEQREYLVAFLNNLEYSYELGEEKELEFSNYAYMITNYQLEKGLMSNDTENYLLELILMSLVAENNTYYTYLMQDNNVINYIKDANYQELNINDKKVIELYSKIVPSSALEENENSEVYDSYKLNELTNNTYISLSLYQLLYNDTSMTDCLENDFSTICYINNSLFASTLKNIFGDISYDISTYEGYDTTMSADFYYDEERNQLAINYYNGDELDDCLYTDIAYAYEVDNKIVIIEKTLYYFLYDSNDPNYDSKETGLYNSVDKEILLSKFNIANDIKEVINKLEPFVTYYAHTFTLSNDGNYYYTDITRLN